MQTTTHLAQAESITETIVTAIADVTDTNPRHVPVLQEVVDVDSLRALVAPSRTATTTPVTVQFDIAGCEVRVSNDGRVVVTNDAFPVDQMTTDGPTTPQGSSTPGSPLVDAPSKPEAGTR